MEENKEALETVRTEESEKVKTEVEDTISKSIIEQTIINNFTEFDVQGKHYRINRPTTNQKQEAYQKKVARYMQLMKEKDEKGDYIYFPEKQLIKIYKERGLDINDIDLQIKSLENKRKDFQEKLGKALTENPLDNELELYKTEILGINGLINEFMQSKANLLEYTLENQSMSFLYEYLTFLITTVKNDKGEYERAFKTFEEFRSADNSITNTIGLHAGLLLGSL